MPLSKEAKKAYNEQYYARNRARINALRLVNLVESGKQKTIREQTVDKYRESFSENELKIVEKNMKKRDPFLVSPIKEGPAQVVEDEQDPVPVVEDEEGPAPVAPTPAPIRSQKGVFTIEQAREVIETRATSAGSKRTYKSRLKPLMRLLVGDENEIDFSLIFKRNTIDVILRKLSKKYETPSAYIQFLLWVLERSVDLQRIVKNADSILARLRKELRITSDREKVAARDEAEDDDTDYEQIYQNLFENEKRLAKKENGSQDHLIAAMYSRAVYGSTKKDLRIIPRNYFWKLWLVRDDKEFKKGENSLNINSGRLFIDDYKTVRRYGQIDIMLNSYLKNLIQKSVKADPRKLLFVNTRKKPYSNSNLFSQRISTVLGIGIDLFRKAIINHELDNGRRRDELAQKSAHSVQTNELVYQRKKTT